MIHFIPSRLVPPNWVLLTFAGHRQVEIRGEELLGEQDDLAGVHFEVADYFVDGLEDGGVAPGAVWLRVGDVEEAGGIEGGDDLGGFVDGSVEGGAGFGAGGSKA